MPGPRLTTSSTAPFRFSFNSENAFGVNRSGWTVGGGLEWMFAPGWSVFGEFNYMDFGNKNVNFVAAPGTVGARRRRSHQARSRAVPGWRELQVQLRWPGRRQVLRLQGASLVPGTEFFPRPIKSPGIVRGFFVCNGRMRRKMAIRYANHRQGDREFRPAGAMSGHALIPPTAAGRRRQRPRRR